jgi:hypothetical protein
MSTSSQRQVNVKSVRNSAGMSVGRSDWDFGSKKDRLPIYDSFSDPHLMFYWMNTKSRIQQGLPTAGSKLLKLELKSFDPFTLEPSREGGGSPSSGRSSPSRPQSSFGGNYSSGGSQTSRSYGGSHTARQIGLSSPETSPLPPISVCLCSYSAHVAAEVAVWANDAGVTQVQSTRVPPP